MEEWRAVVGYEGLYEVSDQGRVRSLDRVVNSRWGKTRNIPGREMSLRSGGSKGYVSVTLRKSGVNEQVSVHRAVLLAFEGPNPPDKKMGLHRNGDSQDNRRSNLRWGSAADNAQDSLLHGTHPEARKTHCIRGHIFDLDNTYNRPGKTGRYCKACFRLRARKE